MEKFFLSFHFSTLLKGKQRPIQILLAGTILALGLVSIPGLVRFVSGGSTGFGDFMAILFIVYALVNFLFVWLQTPEYKSPVPEYAAQVSEYAAAIKDFAPYFKKSSRLIPPAIQHVNSTLTKEDAVGETLIN